MKICRLCKEEKEYTAFHKKTSSRDGFRKECKLCVKEINKKRSQEPEIIKKKKKYDEKRYNEKRKEILKQKKEYYQKNKEELIEKKRIYQKNNREKIRESNKNYQIENLEKIYKWRKEKYSHVIAWRTLLYSTLKRLDTKKQGHTIDELGYSAIILKAHLENLFTPGMSWDNHGDWHIDHIKPVSLFDKDTPASIVCALDNLQPLWATERTIENILYEGNLNKSNNF